MTRSPRASPWALAHAGYMSTRSGRGTPRQTLRVPEALWIRFGAAAARAETDRSALVRALIAWYVREPGARLPERPGLSNCDYR